MKLIKVMIDIKTGELSYIKKIFPHPLKLLKLYGFTYVGI